MAKNQYIGQMVIQYESNLNEMIGMAKSRLLFDEVKTTADVAREIEAITAEQLREVAEEIFHPDRLSTLIYKKR
jgi:predicted Zn-dependent peptidase